MGRSDVAQAVDAWIDEITARWLDGCSDPANKLGLLHDAPRLPGDVSYGAFIDELRSRRRAEAPVPSRALELANSMFTPDEFARNVREFLPPGVLPSPSVVAPIRWYQTALAEVMKLDAFGLVRVHGRLAAIRPHHKADVVELMKLMGQKGIC